MKLEQNSDGDAHKAVITATHAVYHTEGLTCLPLMPQDICDREQWMTGLRCALVFSVQDTPLGNIMLVYPERSYAFHLLVSNGTSIRYIEGIML
jgi:hypothetical protein